MNDLQVAQNLNFSDAEVTAVVVKPRNKGIKSMRRGGGHGGQEPKYKCTNCKCSRYNACTCMKG